MLGRKSEIGIKFVPMIEHRMDKSVFSVANLHEESDEVSYWRNRSPQERFEAIELMRQINYGHDATSARLQRVFEVVELSSS